MRLVPPLVALLVCLLPAAARAQECRRTCHVDETRDANGCCVAPATPAAPSAPAHPLPRRCPAGTNWSDASHACMGHLQCPAGSHPEEGGACVADAVGCPAGSRMDAGRCVADVTCPPNTRLEGGACVSEVSCPANTHLEAGHCISSDVTCPPGTHSREGGGCVGDPVCPDGTHYTEGRGCVGDVVCPAGTHADHEHGGCAPDVVCLEGTHAVEGHGCVDACADYVHSRWDSERRSCVCEHGFTAQNGHCAEDTQCQTGTHLVDGHCIADVICPYGYHFLAGTGCVDPDYEARAVRMRAMEQENARRVAEAERERKARAWAFGPALQLHVGGGYAFLTLPGYLHQGGVNPTDASVTWQGPIVTAGLTFSTDTFILGASYTRVLDPGPQSPPAGWTVLPAPLDLVNVSLGEGHAGEIHTWHLMLDVGTDLNFSLLTAGLAWRSQFRVWRGLFLGFDLHGIGLLSIGTVRGNFCGAGTNPLVCNPVEQHSNGLGAGATGSVFIGYSIY